MGEHEWIKQWFDGHSFRCGNSTCKAKLGGELDTNIPTQVPEIPKEPNAAKLEKLRRRMDNLSDYELRQEHSKTRCPICGQIHKPVKLNSDGTDYVSTWSLEERIEDYELQLHERQEAFKKRMKWTRAYCPACTSNDTGVPMGPKGFYTCGNCGKEFGV